MPPLPGATSEPNLEVAHTLRQASKRAAALLPTLCAEWTYLVFMPSPIFEFRRAVHGSPSVIYHPTENVHIWSARSFQATENRDAWRSLRQRFFAHSTTAATRTHTHQKIWYLNANKKGGNNYFCGSANRTRRNPKNYAPKFPASRPLICALFPQNEIRKKMRRLQRLRLDSWLNYSGIKRQKILITTPSRKR